MAFPISTRLACATVVASLGFCGPALAAWPDDKPIELVVGFSAGGETDVLARTLAPFLQKHLSGAANIVVVNKPGASGAIANSYVQRAPKDGYTVAMVNTPPMNFMPLVQSTPYDPDQFALIGRVVSDPTLLVARDDSPYQSLKELVEAVKAKPGSVSIGQNGLGSNGGVALNVLMLESGASFTEVPFAGTGQSKIALMGGHVDMIFASHTAVPDPAGEKTRLRLLAQFVDARAPMLPNVPTAKEEGFDVVVPSDRGLAVDKGVPVETRDRLQAALEAALKDPGFVKAAQSFAAILAYKPGEAWQADIEAAKAPLMRLAAELKQRGVVSGK
ncbi:tripartite tricarboxylate transporter substrate binding protein [Bordetella petrii]|uniref:tripartite tricarboxylate transporter substrate binding protein n=1 Tax=Bordetella petrii TaxID=94624 RepID=UPI001E4D60D4|nr:tripartite tricarboxylate transporter substrate binding protein [Bordetella petrii]MCD0502421.1 tripartite tricarboxylate transporter substrate binding protein [Bordetella petrii]